MIDQPCVKLYFSNSVEELSSALAANLRVNMPDDPFEFQDVFIPNAPLQKWLQLQVADCLGSVLNVRYSFLEKGLWELLKKLFNDKVTEKLDQNQLQWQILAVFKKSDFSQYPEFKAYLKNLEGLSIHKMWQLSGELARLFLEYERNRPEMIQSWKSDRNWLKKDVAVQLEGEQRLLYNELFLETEKAASFQTLVQFSQKLNWFKPHLKKTPIIHVFGPSQLSVFHKRLLCNLGRYCKVYIYSLNVCSEYWEDITTPGEDKWFKSKMNLPEIFTDNEGEELFEVDENPLLKSWGKPGRESLKIFSELEEECISAGIDYQSFWLPVFNQKVNVLGTLQRDIMQRQTGTQQLPEEDHSLQLLACPSRLREVECVFNSIVKNLNDDPNLKLTDIAVLVSDIDKYKAAINKVFEGNVDGGRKIITYSLIDAKAESESHFSAGVQLLFTILRGDFTRKAILSLFKNPCFQARVDIDQKDVEQCLRWCNDLNMFREEGEGAFSFFEGLRRLRAGRVLGQGIDDGSLISESPENESLLEIFSYYIDYFEDIKNAFQSKRSTAASWQKSLIDFFEMCLAIPEQFPAELTIRTRLYEEIQGLGDFTLHLDGFTLCFEDICEFIQTNIQGIPVSRGMYLGSGITIASLQPMRPVPFEHIYLLGLGENEYPGNLDRSTFDLRNYQRKIGDISLPEKNMYLFLETLVCARQKLFLSYVSQDSKEDKDFKPSRLIEELKNYVRQNMGHNLTLHELPLKAYDPEVFEGNYHVDGWRSVVSHDASLARAFVERSDAAYKSREDSSFASIQEREIPLAKLAMFLMNPADSYLRNNCGLPSFYTDDSAVKEDEPFSSTKWQKEKLLKQALLNFSHKLFSAGETSSVLDELNELYCKEQRQSSMPQSVYGDIDLEDCQKAVMKLVGKLEVEEFIRLSYADGFKFGPFIQGEKSWEASKNLNYKESYLIELVEGEAFVSGHIEDVFWDEFGVLQKIISIQSAVPTYRHVLQPFLNWCLAYLKGDCQEVQLIVFNLSRAKPLRYNFSLQAAGWESIEDLENWFCSLINSYISGAAVYLPISLHPKLANKSDGINLNDLLEQDQNLEKKLIKVPDKLLDKEADIDSLLGLLSPFIKVYEAKSK